MYTAKVVMHEVQRHGMAVILKFFAESVREARESAHPHPHGQVLPLHETGRDMLGVRVAADRGRAASDAGCRAIPAFAHVGRCAVNLNQHAVVDVSAKGILNGIDIHAMAIGR